MNRNTISLLILSIFLTISCSKNENAPDDAGIINWQKSFGGSQAESLYDILALPSGGYFITGLSTSDRSGDKTEDSRGSTDFWCVRTNANGDILWDKTMGGDLGESARAAAQTTDGGFVLGGYSNSGVSGDKLEPNLGRSDVWVVKLDSDGNEVWQNTLGEEIRIICGPLLLRLMAVWSLVLVQVRTLLQTKPKTRWAIPEKRISGSLS